MEVIYKVLCEANLHLCKEVKDDFNEEQWKKSLMRTLLDNYIDTYGVDGAILYLIDLGLTRKQLQELKFNEKDIENNFRRLSKYETES